MPTAAEASVRSVVDDTDSQGQEGALAGAGQTTT
jgi:hypothetical protein